MINTNTEKPEKTCKDCKHLTTNNITGATLCWKRGNAPKRACKNWKPKTPKAR